MFALFCAVPGGPRRKKGSGSDTAAVFVNFDLGGGGSGFAPILYAQEVTSRETFRGHYSSGSHGLVTLPTSSPVAINVTAPGTYVFYAMLRTTAKQLAQCPPACTPCTHRRTSRPTALASR